MTQKLLTFGWNRVQCESEENYQVKDTDIFSQWNRIAHAVVGNSLANDVLASAKFYAKLNYALSNAAIASWDPK
jgi:hypothetical protein